MKFIALEIALVFSAAQANQDYYRVYQQLAQDNEPIPLEQSQQNSSSQESNQLLLHPTHQAYQAPIAHYGPITSHYLNEAATQSTGQAPKAQQSPNYRPQLEQPVDKKSQTDPQPPSKSDQQPSEDPSLSQQTQQPQKKKQPQPVVLDEPSSTTTQTIQKQTESKKPQTKPQTQPQSQPASHTQAEQQQKAPAPHIPGQHPEAQYGVLGQSSFRQNESQEPSHMMSFYQTPSPSPSAPTVAHQHPGQPTNPRAAVPKSLWPLVGYTDRPVASFDDPFYHGPDIGFETNFGETSGPPSMPGYDYFQDYPASGGDVPKFYGQGYGGPIMMAGKEGAGFVPPPQVTKRYEPVIRGRDYGYGVVQQSSRTPAPRPSYPQPIAYPQPAPTALPPQQPSPQQTAQTQPTGMATTQPPTPTPATALPTTAPSTAAPPVQSPVQSTQQPISQTSPPQPGGTGGYPMPEARPPGGALPTAGYYGQGGYYPGGPQQPMFSPYYNPYKPPPLYPYEDPKTQDKLIKKNLHEMKSPFADAGKFDFDSKNFKHFYDGGQHTGLMRGMQSPGFSYNDVPTSSGMMMNDITPNDDPNDFRLTGRDFVSLDWQLGGQGADDDDDYDSESDAESEPEKLDEKIQKEKEFEKFDYLEEDQGDSSDDQLSSYDDEDYDDEEDDMEAKEAKQKQADLDKKIEAEKAKQKIEQEAQEKEKKVKSKKKKSKKKEGKNDEEEDDIYSEYSSEEDGIYSDDDDNFSRDSFSEMEEMQFEQPLMPLKMYKDPNAPQQRDEITDPWAWNNIKEPQQNDLLNALRKGKKKQDKFAKTFNNDLEDNFYSRHYEQHKPLGDKWEPQFHHEQLEWPVHERQTYEDKFWTHGYQPKDTHSSPNPYEESHLELQERQFFERAHAQTQQHFVEVPVSETTKLLHDNLHAAQHITPEAHSLSPIGFKNEHHESEARIAQPVPEYDFARYSEDHALPGQHRVSDPHDKLYDKHFKTYYHEETPTIPGTDHSYKSWQGDFQHDIQFDVDSYNERARDHKDQYYEQHYDDAHDVDYFAGQRPKHTAFHGDDDEDFKIDLHHLEAPRSHHLGDTKTFQAAHEKRPSQSDFEHFDWQQYQISEDMERRRKQELAKLLEHERQIQKEEEEKRKAQEAKQKKLDEEAEKLRIQHQKELQEIEYQQKIQREAEDAQRHAKRLAEQAKQAQEEADRAMAAYAKLQKQKEADKKPAKTSKPAPVVSSKPSISPAPVSEPVAKKAPEPVKQSKPIVTKQVLPPQPAKPTTVAKEQTKKVSGQKQDGIPVRYHEWEDEIPVYPGEHHIFWDVAQNYNIIYDPHYSSYYDQEHHVDRRFANNDYEHQSFDNDFEEPNYLHTDQYYIDHYDHDFHHLAHPKAHYWDKQNGGEQFSDQRHLTQSQDEYGYDHEMERALLSRDYHEHNDHHDYDNDFTWDSRHKTGSQDERGYDHEMERALLSRDYHEFNDHRDYQQNDYDFNRDQRHLTRSQDERGYDHEMERALLSRDYQEYNDHRDYDAQSAYDRKLKSRQSRRQNDLYLDHDHGYAHSVEGSDSRHIEVGPLIEHSYDELAHDFDAQDLFHNNEAPFYIHSKYIDDSETVQDVGSLLQEVSEAHRNETPLYIRQHLEDPLFLEPVLDPDSPPNITSHPVSFAHLQ